MGRDSGTLATSNNGQRRAVAGGASQELWNYGIMELRIGRVGSKLSLSLYPSILSIPSILFILSILSIHSILKAHGSKLFVCEAVAEHN